MISSSQKNLILTKIFSTCRLTGAAFKKKQTKVMDIAIFAHLKEKPRTIQELAALMSTNHSLMSDKISNIEEAGYIQKEPGDDQRYKVVKLTPAGEDLLQEVSDGTSNNFDKMFIKFDEEEIKQFAKMISKISH